ncbi:MAG: tetratricopeptide repeat protein [Pirellulales bacterium]|nr:tetratricopeptide repeat protein [Pirellulales bacterium]
MSSLAEQLDRARKLDDAGDHAAAEQIYREILAASPDQPEALFHLASLATEAKRHDEAIGHLRRLIETQGPRAPYYNNLGHVYEQAGDPHESILCFRQALTLEPDHPEAHNNLGVVFLGLARAEEAVREFEGALAARPDFEPARKNLERARALLGMVQPGSADAAAHNRRGIELIQAGKPDEALPHFETVIRLEPANAGARFNLGNLYSVLGRAAAARASHREAVRLNPKLATMTAEQQSRPSSTATARSKESERFAALGTQHLHDKRYGDAATALRRAAEAAPDWSEVWNNLGVAQMYASQLDEAAASLHRAIELDPAAADALNNLGLVWLRVGQLDEAVSSFQRSLALQPDSADVTCNLGNALRKQGYVHRALDAWLRTVALEPRHAAALGKAGLALHELGRASEADGLFRRAFELDPKSADVLNNWGNVHQDLQDFDRALDCYRQAVAADPDFVPAHCSLGYLLNDRGQLDEARKALQRALELQPDNLVRVMLATALPPVYASLDDLHARRAGLEQNLTQLIADGVTLDTTRTIVPTMFYIAYQGQNDRRVQEDLARIYRAPHLPPPRGRRTADGRVRVGFLSRYFREHTIGRLNLGLIKHLSRERFEVHVIAGGTHQDGTAEEFRRHADHFHVLPYDPQRSRQMVRDLELQLIFYADIGMDPLTYTLGFSRMAPVQCVTWGHPDTTGSAAMDYFISSELLETAGADEHYTEQLVRLPDLSVCYERPVLDERPRDRASFGLDPARHLYICPQSLFKFHPEFDAVLGEILRRDPQGDLVLLEGKYDHWKRLLMERFSRTIPDVVDRIRFLGRLKRVDFLALNAAADVSLDPMHFGGGNTTYEALALGTPVVTLPGDFLRSRISLALYTKMGCMDCVVRTPDQYVDLAVKLGTDRSYREGVRRSILATADVLFDNRQAVRDLEAFFLEAIDRSNG